MNANLLDFIIEIFLMRWLWSIFAGFYLIAYTFWVPGLFNNRLTIISVFAVTLVTGLGLLTDGFLRAMELESGTTMPSLPFKQLWMVLGAVLLFGYLLVYIPPKGRIVAHWPWDLVVTFVSGVVMLAYGLGY